MTRWWRRPTRGGGRSSARAASIMGILALRGRPSRGKGAVVVCRALGGWRPRPRRRATARLVGCPLGPHRRFQGAPVCRGKAHSVSLLLTNSRSMAMLVVCSTAGAIQIQVPNGEGPERGCDVATPWSLSVTQTPAARRAAGLRACVWQRKRGSSALRSTCKRRRCTVSVRWRCRQTIGRGGPNAALHLQHPTASGVNPPVGGKTVHGRARPDRRCTAGPPNKKPC